MRPQSVIAEKRAKILLPVHCQLTRHQDTLMQVNSACVSSRAAQVGQQEKNWHTQEERRMAFISRRSLLSSVALAGASILVRGVSQRGPWAQGTAPALVTSDSTRPSIPYGVASGDVTSDAAIIWSRTNKPSRMLVE